MGESQNHSRNLLKSAWSVSTYVCEREAEKKGVEDESGGVCNGIHVT